MKCAQPWRKMPPPPWALLVMVNPSMLDGLQLQWLGYGLFWLVILAEPLLLYVTVWHSVLASPTVRAPVVPGAAAGLLTTPESRVVVVGNAPPSVPSVQGA